MEGSLLLTFHSIFTPVGYLSKLIFDILKNSHLRDSFLDPQSSESSRRVGVPALSHQLAHHSQCLLNEQRNNSEQISLMYACCFMPVEIFNLPTS